VAARVAVRGRGKTHGRDVREREYGLIEPQSNLDRTYGARTEGRERGFWSAEKGVRPVNGRGLSRIDKPDRLSRITTTQALDIIECCGLGHLAIQARIRRRHTLRGDTTGHDISTWPKNQSLLVQPFTGGSKMQTGPSRERITTNWCSVRTALQPCATIDSKLAGEYRVRQANRTRTR
jgi:hypothetical protein